LTEASSSSPFGNPVAAEALAVFPGVLIQPKLSQVRRVAASGRSLGGSPFPEFRVGVSRSVLPAETPFRPKPVGCPGWITVAAEALAVFLRSAVPAEADRFLRLDSRQDRNPGGSPPKRRVSRS
jgi:hypothetical protein